MEITEEMLATLPEEIKTDEASMNMVRESKDFSTLAKNFVETKKMVGGSLRMPGENATPEEWSSFHGKMGRPETVEGYEFKKPDNLPKGMGYDEKLEKSFLANAHNIGVSKKHAQGIFKWYNEQQVGVYNSGVDARKKAMDGLKTEFGHNFDNKIALAQRGIKKHADDATIKYLEDTGIGDDPGLIKVFASVGAGLKEDTGNLGDDVPGGVDKASALIKIAEIRNNKAHPYHDRTKPGYAEAQEEMNRYYAVAYPDGVKKE